MTMKGFSEREPDDWDTALGTVRGYRWWQISVPLEPGYVPRYDLPGYSPGMSFDMSSLPQRGWVPARRKSAVHGMYGSQWAKKHTTGTAGKYTARCMTGGGTASGLDRMFVVRNHSVDPKCGCGFWAYWRELPHEWDACLPYVRRSRPGSRIDFLGQSGYSVVLPLAGVIEGSGRTIIGERGFRCEYARITDLTFSTTGDCVYYEEQSVTDYHLDIAGGMLSPSLGSFLNPRNGGNFHSFIERELETPADVLIDSVRAVARDILGDEITWHADTDTLLRNCPPDRNYA